MSWQLRATTIALRAYTTVKRGAGTAESMQESIKRSRAKPPKIPPSPKAVRGLAVSSASVDGVTVFELRPPCGRLYAGELDGKDPRVSPIFGEMKGLASIDLFIGSHDVSTPTSPA